MLGTAKHNSTNLDSRSSAAQRSASAAAPMDPCRVPRGARCDLFNSYELSQSQQHTGRSSHGSRSPVSRSGKSSPQRDYDNIASPTTLPHSFNALRESVHTLGMRVSNSPGQSPSSVFDCLSSPVLNIRRTPSASPPNKEVEELSLDPRPRRHHRRRTTSRGDREQTTQVQTDGTIFPTTLDDLHHCDEKHCTNHHHRQSSSSTVSIKCDKSDEDEAGLSSPGDSEIETSIHMEPCAPQMLVPLVDRPAEMAELLEHRSNKDWASLVRRTFGEKTYKTRCLPLWTETGRRSMPDREWLRRSKELLVPRPRGGYADTRLWSEFCAMVGWDESEEWAGALRSYSHDSSPQMNAILEVEEENLSRR